MIVVWRLVGSTIVNILIGLTLTSAATPGSLLHDSDNSNKIKIEHINLKHLSSLGLTYIHSLQRNPSLQSVAKEMGI
jgi:hypothetical protein